MSDSEREARLFSVHKDWREPDCNVCFLLGRLKEARAEIAGLKETLAGHQDELGLVDLREQIRFAKEEIARRDTKIARMTDPPHKHDFDLAKEAAQTVSLNWKEHARYAITDQDLLGMIEQATLNAISRSKMTTPPGASEMELSIVELLRPWEGQIVTFRNIKDLRQQIAGAVARATEQAERAAHNAAIEAATQIAQRYRSEAILERYKMFDEERKACWLWALDTSNGIERAIRALRKPPGS